MKELLGAAAFVFAAAVILLRVQPVQAMNGQALLDTCGPAAEAGDAQLCAGYLEGVIAAGHAEMVHLRSGCSTSKCRVDTSDRGRGFLAGHEWCLPEAVTSAEAADVIRPWLEDHPFERQGAAPPLIARVLAETWPCDD